MKIGRLDGRETWRVLAVTLAVALAFVALGRLQLALFDGLASSSLMGGAGLVNPQPDAALIDEAAQVAAASRSAVQRLPVGHRLAAFRMGYEIGFVSNLVGSVLRSDAGLQNKVRGLADKRLGLAKEIASTLGIRPEADMPVRSLKEFADLGERFENDENGAAARVQQQLSPLHRHLYLLGAHLGMETARIETSGGELSLPPASLIRRHATLVGIAPALWLPLAQMPKKDEAPAQRLARWHAAIHTLTAALAQAEQDTANEPRKP